LGIREPRAGLLEEDLLEQLRRTGLKATIQRFEILKVLLRERKHLSLKEVHEKVGQRLPTISLSTVYNTLRSLVDVGLLRELNVSGETRYDINVDPHVDLIWLETGEITDFMGIDVASLIKTVEEKTGMKVKSWRVEFHGVKEE
jgi:Fe2+ or Zn2+ uptake regulation protein